MKRVLLVLTLLIATAVTARSYVYETHGGSPVRWPNAQATVHHDPVTITGAYVSELQAALAVWSSVSGSAFRFTHGGASQAANVKDSSNGSTDVYIDNSLPPYGYAVTMVNTPYTGADITERDVAFNGNVTWTTNATNKTGGPIDFRTVAIHELGHVLGLMHESKNASVMNVTNVDPAFARHSLEADDRNAVVFLYPGTGPGPGPGPGPTGVVDLIVRNVDVTPPNAGPGDAVELTYEIQNIGTTSTGAFTAGAFLTGTLVPSVTDPAIGIASEAELGPGDIRSGRISGVIPADLLPGKYRYGVLLDTTGAVAERNEANNGAASGATLAITRPPIEVGPGQTITGELGPKGEDTVTVTLPYGATLKARGKLDSGRVVLTAHADGAATPLFEAGPTRKAKGKFRAEHVGGGSGTYVVRLLSTSTTKTTYRLRLRAKAMKSRGGTQTSIPVSNWLQVYRGSVVKLTVRGTNGYLPDAEFEGLSVSGKIGKMKVKFGPFSVAEDGVICFVMRPPEGVSLGANWKAVVKPARPEVEITR